jgi:transposase
MQVSHMKLCASRAFWLVAYPSQGHEMLFDAHTRSFNALGGVARRGIYDTMRTAVDRVGRGKTRTVNARFAAMCAHYLFNPDFCNVASGWEKGVVEKCGMTSGFGATSPKRCRSATQTNRLESQTKHHHHSAHTNGIRRSIGGSLMRRKVPKGAEHIAEIKRLAEEKFLPLLK